MGVETSVEGTVKDRGGSRGIGIVIGKGETLLARADNASTSVLIFSLKP